MADGIDALIDELYASFTSLQEQGLLDEQFIANYEVKPDDSSMFFTYLVQSFKEDIRSVMRDLALALEHPAVDYSEINEYYTKIKRKVTSFGTSVLNLPLEVLRLGVADSSQAECNFALLRIHQEYHKLRPHLETILENSDPIDYMRQLEPTKDLECRIINLARTLAVRGGN